MKRTYLLLLLCITAPMVLAANNHPTARPNNSGGGSEFFRCHDEHGQAHFGDSMPAECVGLDTEVLSARGNVVRMIDGTKSLEDKAARKSADDAEKKAKTDAELRDHMLIDTYLSVADIERLRDQRVDLVKGQLTIDEQTLVAILDRQTNALNQVQHFRPYSTAANARSMPDNLVADMVSLANSIRITEERIAAKRTEMQDLQAKFTSDVLRFKELKGLK